ncbi:hypothetical protein [Nocardioides dilutus]
MKLISQTATHPATWIAAVALVASAGGAGYAAGMLTGDDIKDGSLTGKDVKNGSLTGKDAKDGSLTGKDVKDGSLSGAEVEDGSLSITDADDSLRTTFTTVTFAGQPTAGTHEETADCPAGSTVVSGGFVVSPNVTGVSVARSYAVDQDTWLVRVVADGLQETQVTIVAHCVS